MHRTEPSEPRDPNDLQDLALPPNLLHEIEVWLRGERYVAFRPALQQLVARTRAGDADARAELLDAFAEPLPIGTGGRRGVCGVGPNRVNAIVLRETAQGLADAMRAASDPPRVAVFYDTRRDSREFAGVVAEQLAANGLEVLLVDAPRATPQLSFTVRARACGAGVMISASHNPPQDNGIKVYDADGAQVLGARDVALMQAIRAALDPRRDLPEATPADLQRIERHPAHALTDIDEPYLDFVAAQGVVRDGSALGLRVAFTPLHGVGAESVVPVLRRRGIVVDVVEKQCDADGGRFSTVSSANPEDPASMTMARELAEARGADLVLATDPDADRLGALARDRDGQFVAIDGNRLGVLMLDHILRHAPPTSRGWVVTTMVTTPLIGTLARAAGIEVVDDLLVGFKHHAGMMREQPDRELVFACEESHGYLRGNEIRDKDGAIAALLLAECAALAKREGRTLLDELDRLFLAHGYHRERTANLLARGAAGRQAIAAVMEAWRKNPPPTLGGLAFEGIDDRATPRTTGSPTRDLTGNVVRLTYRDDGGRACVVVLRPSGTEPKLKVYAMANGPACAPSELEGARASIDGLVVAVLRDAEQRAAMVMAPFLS